MLQQECITQQCIQFEQKLDATDRFVRNMPLGWATYRVMQRFGELKQSYRELKDMISMIDLASMEFNPDSRPPGDPLQATGLSLLDNPSCEGRIQKVDPSCERELYEFQLEAFGSDGMNGLGQEPFN